MVFLTLMNKIKKVSEVDRLSKVIFSRVMIYDTFHVYFFIFNKFSLKLLNTELNIGRLNLEKIICLNSLYF